AEAAAATVAGGRGVVAVLPDGRDCDRLDAALTAVLGPGRHVTLSAALGPAERYRRFLAVRRGAVAVAVGTRAAAFAPVERLGLVALWDDGDDVHAEPRAPYPHAREVLLTRAQLAGAGALLAGFARSAEGQLLVETGWAREVVAARAAVRARAPEVAPAGDDPQLARDPAAATARLPSLAWQAARGALGAGAPVLVQVPRRGYLPAVSCAGCRAPARCPHCAGPLELNSARGAASCRWCGRGAAGRGCPHCGARALRAAVTGARRTAEELGRAFPGVPVRTSGRDEVLATVPGGPALVVATPGAEPVADGGYGAVLLLDAWALLTRADLRAGEEALRRWLAAAALARPAAAGGRVVVVADGALPPVQALLRWDPGWYAARELAERRELGFPPAVRMASLTGPAAAVDELLAAARLPAGAQLLGPVPAGGRAPSGGADGAAAPERMLVRVARADGGALASALRAAVAVRTARKAPDPVRVQVDPLDLL
ncbi:MAG TPA: primosome assembly protein PriA, partial [Pilimelia sp.]|nr:primosome assembly protein PriA [Pilimelia sp.]